MKAHVLGISGSGKTSLSRWISARSGVPAYELDWIVYNGAGERPEAEIVRHLEDVRRLDGWVTEGAYTEPWLKPLLDDADVIIWLDVPWQTCVLRMLKRHIRAELARNNRHRGWRKLARFLDYTRRTAPRQRADAAKLLAPYAANVVRCRSSRDLAAMKTRLSIK